MNPILQFRRGIFGKLGSFWHRNLTQESRQQMRDLVHSRDQVGAAAYMNACRDRVTGAEHVYHTLVDLHFSRGDIAFLGPDLQARIVTRAASPTQPLVSITRGAPQRPDIASSVPLVGDPDDHALFLPNGLQLVVNSGAALEQHLSFQWLFPSYVMRIPEELQILSITCGDMELIAGLDFINGVGFLLFQKDPMELFPDGRFTATMARVKYRALHSYSLQIDGLTGSARRVMHYLRDTQTPEAMTDALRDLAGLHRTQYGGTLLYARVAKDGTTEYGFQDEIIYAAYTHVPLIPGAFYKKGTIIGGEMITTLYGAGDWYKSLDWSAGLALDTLCPVPGLTLPATLRRAWVTAESTAHPGSFHVRFELDGAEDAQDRFWAHVAQAERVTGRYLNAVVNLGAVGESTQVNPLFLYFEFLLSNRGVIFDLRTRHLGQTHRQLVEFIQANRPLGVIPIIRES